MDVRPSSSSPTAVSRRRFLKGTAAAAGGLVVSSSLPAWALSTTADTVLVNGRIWTVDASRPWASAIAISGGRLTFVGNDKGARRLIGSGTEVIDLKGKMVMPGIHDGHIHPLAGGRALTDPTLGGAILTLSEFLDYITYYLDQSSAQEPDTWLVVTQWEAIAMGNLPSAEDLDGLATARPIFVRSVDGHIALTNTQGLALAGITDSTPNPSDGVIDRDTNGHATGILYDGAIALVLGVIPPRTVEQNAAALKAAFARMAQRGITTYLDAMAGEPQLAALAALSDAGELTVRPHAALLAEPDRFADPSQMVAELDALRQQYARPDITVNTVKLFFDGAIEYPAQTAAMLAPYLVNEGTAEHPHFVPGTSVGPTYFPPEIANPGIAALDEAGWQVHMHVIGDRAVRTALDAIEYARGQNGDLDNRHTLAHIEAIDPAEFPRFAQLNAMACMQLQWAERDDYTVTYLRPYIGLDRWRRLYAAGSLEDAGAQLCGGSDWPVDPLLPFRQIEMAVNRVGDEVYPAGPKPLQRSESISLRSSVAMHTRNSAYQLHQNGTTGSITNGRAADLIVLDRNVFKVNLKEISTTQVLMTMIDGDIVHLDPSLVT